MLRSIGGIIGGAILWLLAVVAMNKGLELVWADYKVAEPTFAFTLAMMVARLSMCGLASLLSGYIAALIGKDRWVSALGAGVVLLVVFIPVHIGLWDKFPIAYHLTFLASLPTLSLLGGWLAMRQGGAPQMQS